MNCIKISVNACITTSNNLKQICVAELEQCVQLCYQQVRHRYTPLCRFFLCYNLFIADLVRGLLNVHFAVFVVFVVICLAILLTWLFWLFTALLCEHPRQSGSLAQRCDLLRGNLTLAEEPVLDLLEDVLPILLQLLRVVHCSTRRHGCVFQRFCCLTDRTRVISAFIDLCEKLIYLSFECCMGIFVR